MTAHQLARALLAGPDESVTISEYNGGDDVLREVESLVRDEDSGSIVLKTY